MRITGGPEPGRKVAGSATDGEQAGWMDLTRYDEKALGLLTGVQQG